MTQVHSPFVYDDAAFRRIEPPVADTTKHSTVETQIDDSKKAVALPPVEMTTEARTYVQTALDHLGSAMKSIEGVSKPNDVQQAELQKGFEARNVPQLDMPKLKPVTLGKVQVAQDHLNKALNLAEATQLAKVSSVQQEQVRSDMKKSTDPVVQFQNMCMDMAASLEERIALHSQMMQEKSEKSRMINRAVQLAHIYREREELDLDKPENEVEREHFNELKSLLPELRKLGVEWNENGWSTKETREAVIKGCEFVLDNLQSSNKSDEIKLNFMMQSLSSFFHMVVYIQKTLHAIIMAIIRSLERS